MTWNPGPMKFRDRAYEHPKEFFDPKDEHRRQVQYFLEHPEIQALASMFIAHMSKNPVKNQCRILKEAGYFFTRPAEILQAEVDEALKKTNKFGPKEEMKKKYRVNSIPPPEFAPDCACRSLYTSTESVYSSFISESTSASTLPTAATQEDVTPRLDEILWQLVSQALNNALNNMYAAKEREREIFYDEAYLYLMTCVQKAVENVWGPRVKDIHRIIDKLLDDVENITSEKRKLQILATDKLPIKVNRLKNNFKGYAEKEDYPGLQKIEIFETLESRQGTYNRYPKDIFGVYLPICDRSLDVSTTYVPPGCEGDKYEDGEDEEDEFMETLDELSLDSFD